MSKKMSEKKVIESLTPEQEALIPVYRERFRAIGLSTEPTDRIKAEDAVRRSYQYLAKTSTDYSKNPEFVWAESPMKGAKLAAQYAKGDLNVTVKEIQEQASMASYASFEAYWVSLYAYVAEVLPVEKDELIDIVLDIVTNCGAYWTFEDIVVMTPKPSVIKMKDGKLHSTEGPALMYPNGDGVYAVNGERKGSLMEVVIAARNAEDLPANEGDSEAKEDAP